SYLTDYEEIDGGFVAFRGNYKGGKITRKGKIRTGKLDFEDVYFVNELNFNLFSVSQMCDKKNSVLFTDIECIVLSLDFKLTDERGLTCLLAKATSDESNLWHRWLGHVNFKTINKLVKGNGTDISQKAEKPSKKRQNQTRDGKVCENEAQSKSSQLREEKAKKNIT
ncbi:ribonuclease H-like domain-containing protein, partial [Tanacetum coccineum]